MTWPDGIFGGRRVGYLLKDRIVDVAEFVQTLNRVMDGGTAIDPKIVQQLFRRGGDPLSALTQREHEVLTLMAEGQSNSAIAQSLFISEAAVSKHVGNIFLKLELPAASDTNRRVLAVITYLR